MYECHDLRSGLILKPHIKPRESLVMAEQTQCDQVAFMFDVDWRHRPPFPIRHQIFCSTFNHCFSLQGLFSMHQPPTFNP